MEQKSKIEMRNGRIHVRIDEDDTIQTGNESKESMLASLQEAKYANSGPFGFFVALGSIICGSCGFYMCTFFVGILTLGIPICMIIFGALYLNDCPLNKWIPIYLLVGGILGLLDFAVRLIYNKLRSKDDETPPERNWINYFSSFMNFLMFVWFICGAYWVYSEYEPNTDPNLDQGLYCDDTLYSVAFWLITLVFIFLGILCITSMFAFCYFFVYKNRYEL